MVPAAKKKAAGKKSANPKKTRSPKLGHDPLAWINDSEAEELKSQNTAKEESVAEVQNEAVEEPVPVDEELVQEPETPNDEALAEAQEAEGVTNMLDLPSYFGIAQVAEVHQQMLTLLNSDQDNLEILAKDVESIDAAALQLLAAFVKSAKEQGKAITWQEKSDKVQQAVSLLNIEELLAIA